MRPVALRWNVFDALASRLSIADAAFVLAAVLALGAVLLITRIVLEKRFARTQLLQEQAFWIATLDPWRDDPNFEFNKALDALCSREFDHPVRGRYRPTRVEVLRWFDRIRALDRERVARALRRRQKSKPAEQPMPAAAPPLAARRLRRS